LKEGKEIGLNINEAKTKYMILSRQIHKTNHLKIEDYKFERVRNFKYLGVDINENVKRGKTV